VLCGLIFTIPSHKEIAGLLANKTTSRENAIHLAFKQSNSEVLDKILMLVRELPESINTAILSNKTSRGWTAEELVSMHHPYKEKFFKRERKRGMSDILLMLPAKKVSASTGSSSHEEDKEVAAITESYRKHPWSLFSGKEDTDDVITSRGVSLRS
jgi:hypothetical protein